MKDKILIKKSKKDAYKELKDIGFSFEYTDTARAKYENISLKIIGLKPPEANILKQTCLSLGFDAGVHRDVITCKCDYSDALISASKAQLISLAKKLKLQPFRLKSLAKELDDFIFRDCSYEICNRIFDYNETYFMGILNITPDSFSDGGINYDIDTAVTNANEMINAGAKIIDIGGESTSPNSVRISANEEIKRVIPVIKAVRKLNKDILISIDTIHPETVVEAVNSGANILNCVDFISKFESVFDFLKQNKTPIVITHTAGIPVQPVKGSFNGDIVEEIYKYFTEKIDYLKSAGLTENKFILDVGIGFGKSVADQFELIKRAEEFKSLPYPVLYGVSRKSFISKTFGTENRDEITRIYAQDLMSKKINWLRVHDVKAHTDLKNYLSKIM